MRKSSNSNHLRRLPTVKNSRSKDIVLDALNELKREDQLFRRSNTLSLASLSIATPAKLTGGKKSPQSKARARHPSLFNDHEQDTGINERDWKCSVINFQEAFEDTEYLFSLCVGNFKACNNSAVLREHHIQAILILDDVFKPYLFPCVRGGYKTIPIKETGNVETCISDIYRFVNCHLRKGSVMVVCASGEGKSCVAVLGFLMIQFGLKFEEVLGVARESLEGLVMESEYENQLLRLEYRMGKGFISKDDL